MRLLSVLPSDVTLDLCSRYLSTKDVVSLISTNKEMYRFSKGPNFWESLVRHKIAPIQASTEYPALWSARVKRSLSLPDAFRLFQVFHSLSGPIEGLWMMLGNKKGGLYSIHLTEQDGYQMFCRHGGGGVASISFNRSRNCLVATYLNSSDISQDVYLRQDRLIMTKLGSVMYVFCSLPQPPVTDRVCLGISGLCGLYTACYGPHGAEIISVSTNRINSCIKNTAEEIFSLCGPSVLYGLKVTGDPNVPAAELSFIVNCTKFCDIESEISALGADTAIQFFSLQGALARTTLRERQGNIVGWLKGKGQINLFPGMWRPEWVDMSFLIYDRSEIQYFSSAYRVSFSVFFSDMNYMLDFAEGYP